MMQQEPPRSGFPHNIPNLETAITKPERAVHSTQIRSLRRIHKSQRLKNPSRFLPPEPKPTAPCLVLTSPIQGRPKSLGIDLSKLGLSIISAAACDPPPLSLHYPRLDLLLRIEGRSGQRYHRRWRLFFL